MENNNYFKEIYDRLYELGKDFIPSTKQEWENDWAKSTCGEDDRGLFLLEDSMAFVAGKLHITKGMSPEDIICEIESWPEVKKSSSVDSVLVSYRVYEGVKEWKVRGDWKTALDGVSAGHRLSSVIGYGFYKEDITELAKLYKSDGVNEYGHLTERQQKIYDLLEDCNFHKECGDFIDGRFDEYITDSNDLGV